LNCRRQSVDRASEFEMFFEKMLDKIEIALFIPQQFVQNKFHALIQAKSFSDVFVECEFLTKTLG